MKKVSVFLFSAILTMAIMFSASDTAIAQDKLMKAEISAPVDCNGCKAKIEKNIAFSKGVKHVEASIEKNLVVVHYQADKNNAESIAKEITDLGYKATFSNEAPYVKKSTKKSIKEDCKAKCSSPCGGSGK